MKKISIIFLSLLLFTNYSYAINDDMLVNDPGNDKWGLYHELTNINGNNVQAVNLRIHIGTTYFNYTANTGIKFGTIKDFTENSKYYGYEHSNAQYAGFDNEGEYMFNISSPENYKKLVIESKLPSDENWFIQFEDEVDNLEILSWWDGLFFRSDNTTLYSSNMIQKNGYQESEEIFRIYFKQTSSIDEPVEESDIIPITDFNELPVTSGYLNDAKTPGKTGQVKFTYFQDNNYDVKIFYGNKRYDLGIMELPGVLELQKAPLNDGIYYSENGKKYIYYEFQLPASEKPINEQVNIFLDDEDNINGFRPFVSMNLTDGDYVFTDKLKLYAGYHDGGKGKAYADVLFPMDLDDLLSIEIEYQYRWKSFMGWWDTDYKTVRIARAKGEVVDMKTTWQHLLTFFSPTSIIFDPISVIDWGETITRLDNLDLSYKEQYLDIINLAQLTRGEEPLTMNELFTSDYSMYRVYLQTYNDGRYTGYEIHDDIIILDVMYKYEGEIYHVPYDNIDTVSGGGAPEDPLDDLEDRLQTILDSFNSIFAFVNSNWDSFVLVGIGILAIILVLFVLYVIALFVNGTRTVTNTFSKAYSTNQRYHKNKYKRSGGFSTLIFIIVVILIIVIFGFMIGWF